MAVNRKLGADAIVDEVAAKLAELECDIEELRVELAARPSRDDPFAAAGDAFVAELRSLLGNALPDAGAVRRAARSAAAEQAWVQRLGDVWETSDVVAALGVSKQRVSALAKAHRLIVVPRAGRPGFPAWQFAGTKAADRASLAGAHRILVEQRAIDPWSAASWFLADHPELDGQDPVEWLRGGGDPERVLAAAERDAARAAQ
jgi:hypothetical protein